MRGPAGALHTERRDPWRDLLQVGLGHGWVSGAASHSAGRALPLWDLSVAARAMGRPRTRNDFVSARDRRKLRAVQIVHGSVFAAAPSESDARCCAQGPTVMALTVQAENPRAVALYSSLGWTRPSCSRGRSRLQRKPSSRTTSSVERSYYRASGTSRWRSPLAKVKRSLPSRS